jgi:hypothetical protein
VYCGASSTRADAEDLVVEKLGLARVALPALPLATPPVDCPKEVV